MRIRKDLKRVPRWETSRFAPAGAIREVLNVVAEAKIRWLTGLRKLGITEDRPFVKQECECVRIPHELAWPTGCRDQAFSFWGPTTGRL